MKGGGSIKECGTIYTPETWRREHSKLIKISCRAEH